MDDNYFEEGSGTPEESCHLEKRVISFSEDLGLNFIVKPRSIDIGQCVGSCKKSVQATNPYYRFLSRISSHHEPCCVPVEFGSTQVVVNAYNFDTRRYETQLDLVQDVRVTKCGCH